MTDSSGIYLSSALGDIKYVAIARVSEASLLLALPSSTTKKAYAEEVSIYPFIF